MPEPLTVQIAKLAVDGGKLLTAIWKMGGRRLATHGPAPWRDGGMSRGPAVGQGRREVRDKAMVGVRGLQSTHRARGWLQKVAEQASKESGWTGLIQASLIASGEQGRVTCCGTQGNLLPQLGLGFHGYYLGLGETSYQTLKNHSQAFYGEQPLLL